MQANIRQRLIGALVLICLSAILWPVLFSNDINPKIDRLTHIPPAPTFEKFTVDIPQKPADITEVVKYQPEEVVDDTPLALNTKNGDDSPATQTTVKDASQITKDEAKVIHKPEYTKQGLPTYWALQLASFSQIEKANQLKQSLLAKGYKVETRSIQTDSGTMVRVYVGPKLDKSILLRTKDTIDKEFKVQSILVRFSPK